MSVAAKAKTAGTWALAALLCLLFVMAGSAKFGSSDVWTGMFADWGYPDGFVYVIGAVEVGAAVLLLIPSLAAYAAVVLAVVMFGAAMTHLLHGQPFPQDVVFLLLLVALAWVRWPSMWGLAVPVRSASG